MMARKTAFVKLSGDLLDRDDVLRWLRGLTQTHYVVICTGGGGQINDVFKKKGFEIRFGPLGRETKTFEERQVARDVLERNRDEIQDLLDIKGIVAHVIIPVLDIGSVLCHVNGDVFVFAAYLGFDRVYLLTLASRVPNKSLFLEELGSIFARDVGKGVDKKLEKIEIVPFPD